MTIRESIEQQERDRLCAAAALACQSKGRAVEEEQCPLRTVFQRDRDRIIHSNAFRRLKHKTQVYLSPEGDHYRTRLTHTLEVSQIARTIARALQLNEDLAEAISLGHDLGHTPFGHAGERALNDVAAAGFRHFEQSLRIVERLEKNGRGLNLTAEVRDGIVCHTRGTEAFTAEGRIVRLADHIAYMNHDIDDSIRAGVLTENDIPREVSSVLGVGHSTRIGALISDVVEHSENGVIRLSDRFQRAYDILLEFLYDRVYRNPVVKGEESKAESMIKHLFEHYLAYPGRLPEDYAATCASEGEERAILDYISSMSDHYAVNQFINLTVPRSWDR